LQDNDKKLRSSSKSTQEKRRAYLHRKTSEEKEIELQEADHDLVVLVHGFRNMLTGMYSIKKTEKKSYSSSLDLHQRHGK